MSLAWQVARQIAATEGPRGFTRGLVPRTLMLAPVSGFTIAFYSVFKQAAVQAGLTKHAGSSEIEVVAPAVSKE